MNFLKEVYLNLLDSLLGIFETLGKLVTFSLLLEKEKLSVNQTLLKTCTEV